MQKKPFEALFNSLLFLRNYFDLMNAYIRGKMYITGVVSVNTFLFTHKNLRQLSVEGTLIGAIQEVGGVYSNCYVI